jgi:predicted  nucleic acid-binding Zn-ribbon protein
MDAPDSSPLDLAYRRIYEWYKANQSLLLQDEIQDFPEKGGTLKLGPDYRKQSLDLIARMPEPDKASDEDRRRYLIEVSSNRLEWAFRALNGDEANGMIARSALSEYEASNNASTPQQPSNAAPSATKQQADTPASSDEGDAVHLNPSQWELSRGTSQILRVAGTAARRSGGKLSTTLLVISIAELSRPVRDPQWAADFLASVLQSRWSQFREMRTRYLQERRIELNTADSAAASTVETSTRGVAALVARAEQIAVETTRSRMICGRHLLGAIFALPRQQGGGKALTRLEEIGVDLDLVAAQLFQWVRGYGDNDEAWRALLVGNAPAQSPLAGFKSDNPNGPDQLGITPDVDALATLIAARTVAPPLSIGLFGDWGSGKTFFMRQLRAAVGKRSALALASGKMQRDVDYYKHIVQIDFNAWHYVEGNLWASLVEHILDNLVTPDNGDRRTVLRKMQQHWIDQLGFTETALAAADAQTRAAGDRVVQAEAAVRDAKQQHEDQTQRLQELSAKRIARAFKLSGAGAMIRAALVPLGLKPASDAVNDLQASLREAKSTFEHGSAVLTPLLKAPDRAARWVWLSIVLLGPPAVGTFISLLITSAQGWFATIGGTVTALVGGLATWIARQVKWAGSQIGKIEEAQQQFDKELAEELASTAADIARTQQELALTRQDLAAAQATADKAAREVLDARKALAEATPGNLLGRYVADRAASSDYRKHLGVLAVVRDDFETLSELIEAENWRLSPDGPDDKARLARNEVKIATEEEEKKGEATRINRIVLYIDDLDRCPPAKVVDVLQAVHLLLAFPLFVVVVGVDARWISRSLQTRYRELLRADGTGSGDELARMFGLARSEDYLEKIFQIPLWLRAMEPGDVRRLVRGLVGTGENSQNGGQGTSPQTKSGTTNQAPSAAPNAAAPGGSQGLGGPTAAQTPTQSNQPGGRQPLQPVTTPVQGVESLQISEYEVSVMDRLAPLLGRSPRALKRFINVYRLVKARLSPAELSAFMRRPKDGLADFEVALFLLAVDSGLPRISASVALAVSKLSNRADGVTQPLPQASDETRADWTKLKEWLTENNFGPPFPPELARPAEWVRQVSRFSFQAEDQGASSLRREDDAAPNKPVRQKRRRIKDDAA